MMCDRCVRERFGCFNGVGGVGSVGNVGGFLGERQREE